MFSSLTAEASSLQSSKPTYVLALRYAPPVSLLTRSLQGEFLATGAETGTKFTGVELYEGEWFDYDEKAGEEVSITNIHWEIRRA
jgi:hypothetical protein